MPYCLARIPQGDEFRGNLAAGGRGEGRPLSERDRWIAAQVGPEMKRRGMLFVGLDVIGDYLTEVNVTSPTCIRELDAQFGLNIAGLLFDAIEAAPRPACTTLIARPDAACESAVAAAPPPQIGDRAPQRDVRVVADRCTASWCSAWASRCDDAAPVVPTLDVILTQTATPADAEAGRLPRPGQQPGRRRARQEPRARAKRRSASVPQADAGRRAAAAARAVAARRSRRRRRAWSPRTRGDARTVQPRDHADAREAPVPRRPARRSSATWRWRACAAEIHLRSRSATPSARSASSSRPARRNTRTPRYLRAWVDRVERVGNLNYPGRGAPPPLGGQLVISVAIRRDGTVETRRHHPVQRHPAARRRRAAHRQVGEPFAPLPKTPENVDVLHVTRTWQFLPGGELIDR